MSNDHNDFRWLSFELLNYKEIDAPCRSIAISYTIIRRTLNRRLPASSRDIMANETRALESMILQRRIRNDVTRRSIRNKKKGSDHLYYERVCLRLNRQVYMKRPPNNVA